MLWKHRDTSASDNNVEYVAPASGAHGYVALFNATDRRLEEAWTGMNDVGFAIMNTASYNIKDDNVPASKMDREGVVMTIALRSCRTVDDFAALLEKLPRPMGVEANFGVIDAEGNGAFFETNNHSFIKYDLADAEDGILIRTNYSHSGRENEGYGFIREANAEHLLRPYAKRGELTPELLTEIVSRSFYHDMYGRDMAHAGHRWLIDQDFIPRYKSTATIVIEGCLPVEDAAGLKPFELADQYVMWTGLGYPLREVSFHLGDPPKSNVPGYFFIQKVINKKFILSVCKKGIPPEQTVTVLRHLPERIGGITYEDGSIAKPEGFG